MALSGSRLQSQLRADILTQIQANFPVNAGLLPAEKTAINQYQTKLANSMADATGPDVVSEITGNAVVPVGIAGTVTSGAGSGGATITTAPGSVT